LDENISDHLLFFLKFQVGGGWTRCRGKRFKFENMWPLNDSYEECMSSVWASVGGLNAVGSLFKNATACGVALSK